MDSAEQLKQGMESLQNGVDLITRVFTQLPETQLTQKEVSLDSLLSYMEEALIGLPAVEKSLVQLATVKEALLGALLAGIPIVKSRLSRIDTLYQKATKVIRTLDEESVQTETPSTSSKLETPEDDSKSGAILGRTCTGASTQSTEDPVGRSSASELHPGSVSMSRDIKFSADEIMEEGKDKEKKTANGKLAKNSSFTFPRRLRNHLEKELLQAVNKGNYEELKHLIDSGAAVDVKSNNGNTAVTVAVLMGRQKCLSELIKAGADVSIRNKNGSTALGLAAECGDSIIISIILQTKNSEKLKSQAKQALTLAYKCGNKDCESELLKFCA